MFKSLNTKKFSPLFTWFSIIGITILISFTILWFIVFKIDDKYISVINLHDFPIELKVKDRSYDLAAYDAVEITISDKTNIILIAQKSNGEITDSIIFDNLKIRPELMTVVLSNDNYCFFSADIKNNTSSKEIMVQNISSLTLQGPNKASLSLDYKSYNYLYLGAYKPLRADKPNKVIYPILCSEIENKDLILNTVKLYLNYNPVAQRDFLEKTKQKIQSTNSIDELNKI